MDNGEYGRVISRLRELAQKATWLLWSVRILRVLCRIATRLLPNSENPKKQSETAKVNKELGENDE